MTYHLLRTILSAVANSSTHHWLVHLLFGNRIFEEKIKSSLEFSILAHSLFNGSHKIIVHKVRLDQVLDEPWLIPENAAPEGGFDFLLCMAEIG